MPFGFGAGSDMMSAYKANRNALKRRTSLKKVYDTQAKKSDKQGRINKEKSINSAEYQELKAKFELEKQRNNQKRIILIVFLAFLGILALTLILR